jgi:hypothetical protein
MRSLRRLIRDWLNTSELERDKYSNAVMPQKSATMGALDCINFSIRGAQGGWVVETSRYDRITDRHVNELYVLTEYDTMGTELANILSLELLKR